MRLGSLLCDRFIPARAGNTIHIRDGGGHEPVHPRAGGEHVSGHRFAFAAHGSSPRGRGTPPSPSPAPGAARFIPARAGNTDSAALPARATAVHPRAGGEHDADMLRPAAKTGSSPRGRGTPIHGESCNGRDRFIPARAGNTARALRRFSLNTVHPRAGGEHLDQPARQIRYRGSSPRGRGTRRRHAPAGGEDRFIPARAGNTVYDPAIP